MVIRKPIKSEKIKKIFSDVSEEEVVDLTQVEPDESDFTDASDTLTQEEVETALETIAGIADAVLEAEGKEAEDLEYQDVLEIVDEVTQEPEETSEEEIAAIESSVINLTMAQDGEPEELTICTGEDDEIDTVVGADDPAELITPAPIDAEPDAEIAIAANRKVDLSQAKTFKVAINSHWKDIDAVHAKAWDMAEEKTKSAGKTPDMGSKYYGMVMALAKTYYNRLTKGEVWEDAAELGSAKIRAVLSALKKIFSDEKKEYWMGEINDDGSVSIYEHDDYVEKFGEEPEGDPILASTAKAAASQIFSADSRVKKVIASSEEFDGETPPAAEDSPGTDGDAEGIEDEGLLADDSDQTPNPNDDIEGLSNKTQDTDPLGEHVDFGTPTTEEMSLPDQNGDRQQLEFEKVSNSISVLSEKHRGSVWSHLYGKAMKPKSDGTSCVFVRSNLFGLIAVKGNFLKGIKNSHYTPFVLTNKGYVGADGSVYKTGVASGKKTQFLVASNTSNHSTTKVNPVNVVELVESAYVKYLKSSQVPSNSKELEYVKSVNQKRAEFARKVLAQNQSLTQSIHALQQQAIKNSQTVSQVKQQMAAQEYLNEIKQRDEAIASSKQDHSKANIDYLSSLM